MHEVGRVGVRVLPNTKGFHKKLKIFLEKEEGRHELKINLELDEHGLTRDARRAVQAAQERVQDIEVGVDLDRRGLKNLERNLGDLAARRHVTLDVDADTDALRDRFERFARSVHWRNIGGKDLDVDVAPIYPKIKRAADEAMARGETIRVGVDFDGDAADRLGRQIRSIQKRLEDVQAGRPIRMDLWVDPDHLERQLSELRRRHDEATQAIEVRAELHRESAHRIKEQLDDITEKHRKAKIEAEAQVLSARAQLAVLARDRFVTLHARVSEKSLRAASTTLAALSGARMVSNTFERMWDWAKNLDKSIPLISAASSAIALLGQVATTSVSNILSLVTSLAQVAPLALTLPGIAAGFAIGVGVMVAALRDFNTELPLVKRAMGEMQDSISAKFWDRAKAPMESLANSILPRLRDGFDRTATSIGGWFAELSKAFESRLGDGSIEDMFGSLSESIEISSGHAQSLVDIIWDLGRIGARQLPRLAAWGGEIADSFAEWLNINEANGNIDLWVDRAIAKLSSLGSIVRDTGSIFYWLGHAAEEGGAATLEGAADALERWKEIVKSDEFQSKMTGFFKAFHWGLDVVGHRTGPAFTRWLEKLRTGLMEMSTTLSPAIGSFLGQFFDLLSSPAVDQGWSDLLSGLADGLSGFSDHLPGMEGGLGALMSILGTLSRQFLPVLGQAFEWLSGVLEENGPKIEAIITNFSTQFSQMIDKYGPTVKEWIGTFVDWVEDLSAQEGSLGRITGTLIGLWGAFKLFGALGSVAGVLSKLSAGLKTLSGGGAGLGQTATGLTGVSRALALLSPGTIGALGGAAAGIAVLALYMKHLYDEYPFVQEAFDGMTASWGNFAAAAREHDYTVKILNGLLEILEDITGVDFSNLDWGRLWKGMDVAAAIGFADGLDAVTASLDTLSAVLRGDWSSAWANVTSFLNGDNLFAQIARNVAAWSPIAIVNGIANKFIAAGLPSMMDVGRQIMAGLARGITQGPAMVWNAIGTAVGWLVDKAKELLGIHSPSTVFIQIGRDVIAGLIQGLTPTGIAEAMAGVVDAILSGATGAGSLLFPAGQGIVGNLLSGILSRSGDGESSGAEFARRYVKGAAGVDFFTPGAQSSGRMVDGLLSSGQPANSAGVTLGRKVVDGTLTANMAGAATILVQRWVAALTGLVHLSRQAGEAMSSYLAAGAAGGAGAMSSAGGSLARAFASGVAGGSGAARSAGAAVASSAMSATAGYSAYSSGAAIGATFASGIRSQIAAVRSAANALVASARDYLPRSPARVGPFSGSGYGGWGESIADELVAGMVRRTPNVAAASDRMMRAVDLTAESPDVEAASGAAGATHITVQVDVDDLAGIRSLEEWVQMANVWRAQGVRA